MQPINRRPGRPGPSQDLWGFVKDTVFVPPVPANFQELCDLTAAAVSLTDCDMLTRVWKELDYQMSAISAKVDTLSICDIYEKKIVEFVVLLT